MGVEQQYSPAEAAQLLSISLSTLWRLIERYRESGGKDGIGPVYKLGRNLVRIPESAVSRYLDGRLVA